LVASQNPWDFGFGVAAPEDKVVQQAVVTIFNEIYEEDFRGFSYGFRPKRSQHQVLDALYVAITRKKVNWISGHQGLFLPRRGPFFGAQSPKTPSCLLAQNWVFANDA
jgi:hypothetical protein